MLDIQIKMGIIGDVKETLQPRFSVGKKFRKVPPEERRNDLKNRLEEIRSQKGIRQEEFAKSMGVSRQTISSLENGRYNPSIILAYKIAAYFGMTIEEMFLFEEEDTK